jgi:hypothetical protein
VFGASVQAARRRLMHTMFCIYRSKVSARSSEPKATRDSSILVSVIQTRGRLGDRLAVIIPELSDNRDNRTN